MWVSWQWYPQHKGLTTGCIMFCYGASSALQSMLITFLMNPANVPPDQQINDGDQVEYLFSSDIARRLPMSLRVMAGIYGAMGTTALLSSEKGL